MKKIIAILIIGFFPILLIGQQARYGAIFGLNIANWRGDADNFADDLADGLNQFPGVSGFSFSNKPRLGFSAGFAADIPLINSWKIQPEITYSQKGAVFSGSGIVSGFDAEETINFRTDYIDLLLLAKYHFTKGKTKPYVLAGPGTGYLVASKMKVEASIDGEMESDESKIGGLRVFQTNLCMGGGIDLGGTIKFEIRYQFGLSPIFEDDFSDGYKLKNGHLSFNLLLLSQ